MRYVNKVDWWILMSVLLAPIGIAIAAIAVGSPSVWIGRGILVAFIGALCWPCDYTLNSDALVVRSGFLWWRIPFSDIDKVEPTNNSLSSPARSLDRIAISYAGNSVMISPVRKDEFLVELHARARLTKGGTAESFARASS
jgi:hypothetical protein